MNKNAVCRIVVRTRFGEENLGTGFLIARDRLITASHVVRNAQLDSMEIGLYDSQENLSLTDTPVLLWDGLEHGLESLPTAHSAGPLIQADVALLEVKIDFEHSHPIPNSVYLAKGDLSRTFVEGCGFPGLGDGRFREEGFDFSGSLPTYPEMRLKGAVETLEGPKVDEKLVKANWGGLSGTCLFEADTRRRRLRAIVTGYDPVSDHPRLEVVLVPRLLKDKKFREHARYSERISKYELILDLTFYIVLVLWCALTLGLGVYDILDFSSEAWLNLLPALAYSITRWLIPVHVGLALLSLTILSFRAFIRYSDDASTRAEKKTGLRAVRARTLVVEFLLFTILLTVFFGRWSLRSEMQVSSATYSESTEVATASVSVQTESLIDATEGFQAGGLDGFRTEPVRTPGTATLENAEDQLSDLLIMWIVSALPNPTSRNNDDAQRIGESLVRKLHPNRLADSDLMPHQSVYRNILLCFSSSLLASLPGYAPDKALEHAKMAIVSGEKAREGIALLQEHAEGSGLDFEVETLGWIERQDFSSRLDFHLALAHAVVAEHGGRCRQKLLESLRGVNSSHWMRYPPRRLLPTPYASKVESSLVVLSRLANWPSIFIMLLAGFAIPQIPIAYCINSTSRK